jgi:hypothetical protein
MPTACRGTLYTGRIIFIVHLSFSYGSCSSWPWSYLHPRVSFNFFVPKRPQWRIHRRLVFGDMVFDNVGPDLLVSLECLERTRNSVPFRVNILWTFEFDILDSYRLQQGERQQRSLFAGTDEGTPILFTRSRMTHGGNRSFVQQYSTRSCLEG